MIKILFLTVQKLFTLKQHFFIKKLDKNKV